MTSPARLSGPWSRLDGALILGLIAVAAVVPFVTSALAGTLEIPRIDDWSYRRIALDLANTGTLAMDGAAETMLIGQIAVTLPLLWLSDGQTWAFAAAGFVFATASVVGAFVLARQILGPRRAALAAATLPLFPGYLAYATAYMNDVPAMATQFAAVALGAIALSRRPIAFRWLVAAVLIGCLAFSIRHFALAAPAAILVAVVCSEPRRPRTWVLAIGAVAICSGILVFRASLQGQLGDVDRSVLSVLRLPQAATTVALVVLPAAVVAIATSARYWRRRDVMVGAAIGSGIVLIQIAKWVKTGSYPEALMRGLVTQWGVPEVSFLFGQRPELFGDPAWTAINLLALVAVVVVAGVTLGMIGMHRQSKDRLAESLIRSAGTPTGLVVAFVVLVAVGLTAFGTQWIVFDRYLWPLVPPFAALLMLGPPEALKARDPGTQGRGLALASASAAASCAVLAVVAAMFMANSHAFDAARWSAGELLVSEGIRASEIDAGYEWIGYHSTEQATPADPVPAAIWYRGWWRDFRMCGLVSSGDIRPPNGEVTGRSTYQLLLLGGPVVELWRYRFVSPTCERATAAP